MGLLNEQIKKEHKKIKAEPGSVDNTLSVPTGFDIIDYAAGTEQATKDGDEFFNIGHPMGKILMFIGNSQTGKTTLAVQMAYNAIKDLHGDVLIFDYERSFNDARNRITNITGCNEEFYDNNFVIYKNSDLTSEFLKDTIFKIAAMKEEMGKDGMVEYYDLNGEETLIYPPTIFILDSVSVMKTKAMLDNSDKETSNMAGAQVAKGNSELLTSITHLLERYNISLYAIGHITTAISINPYDTKPPKLPGLDKSENVPGGNKFLYLASFIYRLNQGKELKDDKDLNIAGRVINVKPIKTRSAFNNMSLPLVYTAKKGFSNTITNFLYLKSEGVLKGGGRGGMFLDRCKDIKFTQKDFLKVYNTKEEFRKAWDETIEELYGSEIKDRSSDLYVENKSKSKNKDFDEEFDEA
jgi:RecA/RadA recombinase